jgi:type VI secretion system protein VasI
MRNVIFGFLVLAALSIACNGTTSTATPPADEADVAAGDTAAPEEPSATEEPDLGNWQVSDEVNPLDDTRTVIVGLEADEKVKGWLGSSRPILMLQCKSGETSVGVKLGTQASVESAHIGKHTVQIRLDKDEATDALAIESTDSDVLLIPDGQAFAESMIGREVLTFGFTPFEAGPQVTTFTLAGLDKAIVPLREACGW